MLLLLPNHPEIELFFQNIEKMNEQIERLLDRREERELKERLSDFSGSAFSNLRNISVTDKLDVHDEVLIKEISLVNAIFKRFRLNISRVFKAVKTALNSLKEFTEGVLKKALTIIDELIDLLEFLWQKFVRRDQTQ
jgi:DNA-binding ferritin-like protein